jgi:hypothetical protein
MSNTLGIATVTASLKKVLENAIAVAVATGEESGFTDSPKVTTVPPTSELVPKVGANIFLFEVTPNAHARNNDLPTRNSRGDLVQRPRVAIDLHYFVTFYGDDTVLEPQRVMGIMLRTFHTQPVLSPAIITQTISTFPDNVQPLLLKSNLASETDPVRITPTAMTADDLARLWSIFSFKASFSLSATLQASVLFVDGLDTGASALPVTAANVYIDAGGPPQIDQVVAQSAPGDPLAPGVAIFIIGSGFTAGVEVFVDGVNLGTPPITDLSATQIAFTLPTTLLAGTHGLSVARPRLMGTPPTPHVGLSSNLFLFDIPPVISSATATTTLSEVVNGQTVITGTLTVNVAPQVGQRQSVVVLLDEKQPANTTATSALSYTLPVDSRPATDPDTSATITVAFKRVVQGTYLIRMRVAGVTSTLSVDANNQFAAPFVAVGP